MSTVHAGSARPIHVGEASFARRVRAATVLVVTLPTRSVLAASRRGVSWARLARACRLIVPASPGASQKS